MLHRQLEAGWQQALPGVALPTTSLKPCPPWTSQQTPGSPMLRQGIACLRWWFVSPYLQMSSWLGLPCLVLLPSRSSKHLGSIQMMVQSRPGCPTKSGGFGGFLPRAHRPQTMLVSIRQFSFLQSGVRLQGWTWPLPKDRPAWFLLATAGLTRRRTGSCDDCNSW